METHLRHKHSKAPIFEKLVQHRAKRTVSLHVPGHKFGQGMEKNIGDVSEGHIDQAAADLFLGVMHIDATELSGLDDLHDPQSVIYEAQKLAAECFGAEETFFLVGGSTVGNLAMLTTVCGNNDVLLVQRNVHKSVLHGLMLAGVRAVFIQPMLDEGSGIATGLSLANIEQALEQYPEAKGLLVTNPNYYGLGVNLEPIAELMHAHGKPLLVDEAHGAHFGFHPELPKNALASGADAVVQSTHKMLTSMTMSAMLHVQGLLLDRDLLSQRLRILQSSSPSYPLMASLDLARRQLALNGTQRIQQGLEAIQMFRKLLEEWTCYQLAAEEWSGSSSYDHKDPLKLILADATGTLPGPLLQQELEQRGCYTEMADNRYVLLVFSLASTSEDAHRTAAALGEIALFYGLTGKKNNPAALRYAKSPVNISPVSHPIQFDMRKPLPVTRKVRIEEAVGELAGQMVIPYPPGIPVLYPGEEVTAETAAMLQELAQTGVRFQGIGEQLLTHIDILASR
jgi:arginine decarboxylase